MRLKALVLSLAAYLLMTLAAHAAVTVPTPLVSLNASNLPMGDLLVWYNNGTLLSPDGKSAGQFLSLGAPPQVEMVAGRKAVTFNGVNGFRSNFACPSTLTGSNPFTVSLWGLNDNFNKASEEWIVTWTRNGTSAQVSAVGMGNNVGYGVVHHYGGNNDLGWDRGLPTQGQWHSIIVTNSGISAWERVYLDGILVSVENKATQLDIQDIGFPFLLGVVDDPNSFGLNFVGSISSLKVWAQELTVDQVTVESGLGVQPACPKVVNGGFELPKGWSQNTNTADNRSIPGWCISDTYNISNTNRGGIGVCGPNLNLNPGGSPFDNGINPEGTKVLVLSGTSSAGQGVSQYFYLYGGKTYRVHFAYNCKTTGNPTMTVYVNGNPIGGTPTTVNPCDGAGYFTVPFFEFDANFTVPASGYYPIEIEESDAGTNNVLLLDDFRLMAANDPNPLRCDQFPDGLDFGLVAKGSTTETSLTLHNVASATLNFCNNYGQVTNGSGWNISGPDSGAFKFGYYDSNNAFQNYANNSNAFSMAGWEDQIRPVVRFTPGTAQKTFNATLNLTWSNGTFAGIMAIPLKGTVAPFPQVVNGSFELPKAPDWNAFIGNISNASAVPYNYYDYLGDSCKIPNWKVQGADGGWYTMPAAGIGVEDRQAANRFVNISNVPDGRQAMYIQTIADQPDTYPNGSANSTTYPAYTPRTRTVRQYLGGFIPGHSYKISLWAGARNSGTSRAAISVALDNIQLTATNVNASGNVASINNGPYDALNPALRHSSATLTQGSILKLEYQYTATKEGPLALDIIAYSLRLANGNTSWLTDSVLIVDQVQIFDMANTLPALDPRVLMYDNVPQTNTYMAGRNFYRNPYLNPLTFYSGVNTQVGGLIYRLYNQGGGTLNISNWAFEGVNGKHFTKPGTGTIKPYGNFGDYNVYFKPKDSGFLTDKLVLTTNDTTGTYKFPIQGYGFGGPAIQNSSFEQPPVYWGADVTAASPAPNAWVWRSNGSNITPPFWQFTQNGGGDAGISTQMDTDVIGNGATFRVNNGLITQGNQALWMRSSTTASNVGGRSARQYVYGFQAGQVYHFRVWVNSMVTNDNFANFILRVNGTDVIQASSTTIPPTDPLVSVDNINEFTHPYKLLEGDYTPAASGAYNVDLYTPFNDDDSAVLIDAIDVSAIINGVKKWSLFE